jgi:hypothetical protein
MREVPEQVELRDQLSTIGHCMTKPKDRRHSRAAATGLKLFSFEIATAAPARSTLVQVFTGVESKMLFLFEEQAAWG